MVPNGMACSGYLWLCGGGVNELQCRVKLHQRRYDRPSLNESLFYFIKGHRNHLVNYDPNRSSSSSKTAPCCKITQCPMDALLAATW